MKVTEPFIRMQKAKNGKYFQFILVMPPKEEGGEPKEIPFSKGYFDVYNFVNGNNKRFFLVCPLMFTKEDNKYKRYLRMKDAKSNPKPKKQQEDFNNWDLIPTNQG